MHALKSILSTQLIVHALNNEHLRYYKSILSKILRKVIYLTCYRKSHLHPFRWTLLKAGWACTLKKSRHKYTYLFVTDFYRRSWWHNLLILNLCLVSLLQLLVNFNVQYGNLKRLKIAFLNKIWMACPHLEKIKASKGCNWRKSR